MNCKKCGRNIVLEVKDGKSFVKAHRMGRQAGPPKRRTPCPASGDEYVAPAPPAAPEAAPAAPENT